MNSREREAWAKHVDIQKPESALPASPVIWIPGPLPSKANKHEIHFDPGLWAQIEFIVRTWKKQHSGRAAYWVSPSQEVKSIEEHIALVVASKEKARFSGDLALNINLVGQNIDIDNVKTIPDAIQKSGMIENDNQFTRLTVKKSKGPKGTYFQVLRVLGDS